MGNSYKMKYLDEIYENLTPLGKKENLIFLVRNRQSGKIAVKKYVDNPAIPIYEKLSKIKDKHLGKIYDYAYGKEKGLVILEYINGTTLEEYIEKNGPVSEKTACGIVCDLLETLGKIHAAGVVHRDITPANIMLSGDGVLKVIDFGIAREPKKYKNRDTQILGTAGYAAPEQFGFGQTDQRTDIYAVGVLFNELLTGYIPMEYSYKKKSLREIIGKCTEVDAKQRFQSVEKLSDALHNWQKSEKQKKQLIDTLCWMLEYRPYDIWKILVAVKDFLSII